MENPCDIIIKTDKTVCNVGIDYERQKCRLRGSLFVIASSFFDWETGREKPWIRSRIISVFISSAHIKACVIIISSTFVF
jgi:hypothetical protein